MGTASVPNGTLSLISGIANGIFVFWTERDWSQKNCYGNTIEGVIYFFCDAHLWCQVSRTLLQYFQRYCLLSILPFLVANTIRHHLSNLHNRKTSISLKWKNIFQKEKRHSSVFWKAFQISRKYFSCHRNTWTMMPTAK